MLTRMMNFVSPAPRRTLVKMISVASNMLYAATKRMSSTDRACTAACSWAERAVAFGSRL